MLHGILSKLRFEMPDYDEDDIPEEFYDLSDDNASESAPKIKGVTFNPANDHEYWMDLRTILNSNHVKQQTSKKYIQNKMGIQSIEKIADEKIAEGRLEVTVNPAIYIPWWRRHQSTINKSMQAEKKAPIKKRKQTDEELSNKASIT